MVRAKLSLPSHSSFGLHPPMEWIALAPVPSVDGDDPPLRPSQIVREPTPTPTPTKGEHLIVTMERVSTGGTKYVAQFTRAGSGAMSGAERAMKKRRRAQLFRPQKAELEVAERAAKECRRQQVAAAKIASAAVARQQQLPIKMQQQQQRHGMFRWPMSEAERLEKRAPCEVFRCTYCGERTDLDLPYPPWSPHWGPCVTFSCKSCVVARREVGGTGGSEVGCWR
jgi:hypothetical protein